MHYKYTFSLISIQVSDNNKRSHDKLRNKPKGLDKSHAGEWNLLYLNKRMKKGKRWNWVKFHVKLDSPAIHVKNFTWISHETSFTWNSRDSFTWNSREANFTWISREKFTWNSRETCFTWNSHGAILPVICYSIYVQYIYVHLTLVNHLFGTIIRLFLFV